jgi:hypothetical protein
MVEEYADLVIKTKEEFDNLLQVKRVENQVGAQKKIWN